MIPLQLSLTNFLSYRETATLDFRPIHLACISGMNGAGKSSILDAITWALFGNGRSRSDDDLVNRLASHRGEMAEVRLDFELDNNIYRVIRQKKARRATVLEFQIATDYEGDQWKSLTRAKRKETEEGIEEVLGMSYETFTNASFLLQGKADEFTTKTAGKRKEILSDLLGVNVWNRYQAAFVEKRKLSQNEETLIDAQLSEIEQELTEEPHRRSNYEAAQAAYELVSTQLKGQEDRLQAARRTADQITQQRQAVTQAEAALSQAERRLADWRAKEQTQQKELAGLGGLLEQREAIEADFAQWQVVQAEMERFQEKGQAYSRIQAEIQPLELALAQERSRLETERDSLRARRTEVEGLAQKRIVLERELAEAEPAAATVAAQLTRLEPLEAAYEAARAALETLSQEHKLAQQELNGLIESEKKVGTQRSQLAAAEQEVAEQEATLVTLNKTLAELDEAQSRYGNLQQEEAQLQGENSRLKPEMEEMRTKMDRLGSERGGPCPHCGQPLTPEHIDRVLAEMEAKGGELGDRWRGNRDRLKAIGTETAALSKRLTERPKTERTISGLTGRIGAAQNRIETLRTAIADWESGQQLRLTTLQKALPTQQAEVAAQTEKVTQLQQERSGRDQLLQQQRQTEQRLTQLTAELKQIDEQVGRWEAGEKERLDTVSEQLAQNSFLADVRSKKEALAAELAAVGYDAAAHEALTARRAALADAPERQQLLSNAQNKMESLTAALAERAKEIEQQEGLVKTQTSQKESAVALLEKLLRDGEESLETVEAETTRLREEAVAAQKRLTHAETLLAFLDTQRARKKAKLAEREQVALKIQRLRMLEKGCGRDGVQALLIEQAIPEIESAANHLLDQLTNGRMRIEFDTQKELKSKKGELAETLEIRISDESGVRPYENFSGGEQFRVNFAIRIALSQTLARRSGVQLQTLVIDEGFGSQDANGRSRLIEAIRTIEDEFKRILVITHIDELRDAFPMRIEVSKGRDGSQIEVIG